MNDKSLITKMPELLDNHRAERRAKAIVDAQVNHRVEDT